ncbi:MAG TPA: hypothetical protein VGO47_14125 [Chlamydiales bacterium]|nr:hypothetical protein [Chlamydiales bacterium]
MIKRRKKSAVSHAKVERSSLQAEPYILPSPNPGNVVQRSKRNSTVSASNPINESLTSAATAEGRPEEGATTSLSVESGPNQGQDAGRFTVQSENDVSPDSLPPAYDPTWAEDESNPS